MCETCGNMIFYNGYHKSICGTRHGHVRHMAQLSTNYLLPYAVPAGPHAQGAWRFCNECESLFFDGYTPKGVCPGGGGHEGLCGGKGECPTGGGHVADGFNFVLPRRIGNDDFVLQPAKE